jgi:A/G-specific adenine glycosylase
MKNEADSKVRLSSRLLKWYKRNRRDLPWRRTENPYAIWVAEVMLQQTQVATVIGYYDRFLERWPTVEALAAAHIDDVLKMWEGLGYYARARNLHCGAQVVAREFGGDLPRDLPALREIPGIGRYTAAQLASVAFGANEPTIDANIRRVLCRLFALRSDPREPAVDSALWEHAVSILPQGKAGDFNQAMMDLGASICVAGRPRCLICPLTEECLAYQSGMQDEVPVRKPRKSVPHYQMVTGVVWKRGRVLIAQRKPDGLLGGLWEFASGRIEKGEAPAGACVRQIAAETGVRVHAGTLLTVVEHAYTHFRVSIQVFTCEYASGTPRPLGAARVRWAWPSELRKFAWPTAQKKIVEMILAPCDVQHAAWTPGPVKRSSSSRRH